MALSCLFFRCRPGTFNLQPLSSAGCTSCFCYGHSKVCAAAAQFREHHILSDFRQGKKSPRSHLRGVCSQPGGAGRPALGDPAMVVWVGVRRRGSRRPQPSHLPQAHTARPAGCVPLRPSVLSVPVCTLGSLPGPAFSSASSSLCACGQGWELGMQQPLGPAGNFWLLKIKIGLPWSILVLTVQAQSPGLHLWSTFCTPGTVLFSCRAAHGVPSKLMLSFPFYRVS